MARLRRSGLSVALVAALLHGFALTGCGGSSSTGSSGAAQVRMVLTVPATARVAVGARSAAAGGAEVFVDGGSVGFADERGEIVLSLEAGTYVIMVKSGSVSSAPFEVTVAEGDVVTLEVELEEDGTLEVEQDVDHDGDYDEDDHDDADHDEEDSDGDDEDEVDDDDDDDGHDDDHDTEHTNGTFETR